MKRAIYIYIIGIAMTLFHLSAMAQTDGYNPSNPPNPDSELGKYKLELASSPSGVCSFNRSQKSVLQAGVEYDISAYLNSSDFYCIFTQFFYSFFG